MEQGRKDADGREETVVHVTSTIALDRDRKQEVVTARGKLTLVRDTSPKANVRYFELLRQAGPERRLGRQKLAERLYGAEVARRVFAERPA